MTLPPGLVLVRATVNLPGLRFGDYAYVDPEDDYMRGLIDASLLVVELDTDLPDLV